MNRRLFHTIIILLFSINGFTQQLNLSYEKSQLVIDTPFVLNFHRDFYKIKEGRKCDSILHRDTIYWEQFDFRGRVIWCYDNNNGYTHFQFDNYGKLIQETSFSNLISENPINRIEKTFYYYNNFDSLVYKRIYYTRLKGKQKKWSDWKLEKVWTNLYDSKKRLIKSECKSTDTAVCDKFVLENFYNSDNTISQTTKSWYQYLNGVLGFSLIHKTYIHLEEIDSVLTDTIIRNQDTSLVLTRIKLSKSRKKLEFKNEFNQIEKFKYDEKDRLKEYSINDTEYFYQYFYDDKNRIIKEITNCKKCCFHSSIINYYYN